MIHKVFNLCILFFISSSNDIETTNIRASVFQNIYIYMEKSRPLFSVAEIVMKIDAQIYPIIDEAERDTVIWRVS